MKKPVAGPEGGEKGVDPEDGAADDDEGKKNLRFAVGDDSYEEQRTEVHPSVRGRPVPAGVKGAHYISPRMRARMDELGLREADISAVVGTGAGLAAGEKKPVWSDEVEAFVPVTEAEQAMTFDHRVVDGGGAGLLLARISELLQTPEAL